MCVFMYVTPSITVCSVEPALAVGCRKALCCFARNCTSGGRSSGQGLHQQIHCSWKLLIAEVKPHNTGDGAKHVAHVCMYVRMRVFCMYTVCMYVFI